MTPIETAETLARELQKFQTLTENALAPVPPPYRDRILTVFQACHAWQEKAGRTIAVQAEEIERLQEWTDAARPVISALSEDLLSLMTKLNPPGAIALARYQMRDSDGQ